MASRLRDLTYAFRRISKSPGIAVAAVVSIGLGIAANATIFSIVSTFVLRPAPVGDPSTWMTALSEAESIRNALNVHKPPSIELSPNRPFVTNRCHTPIPAGAGWRRWSVSVGARLASQVSE